MTGGFSIGGMLEQRARQGDGGEAGAHPLDHSRSEAKKDNAVYESKREWVDWRNQGCSREEEVGGGVESRFHEHMTSEADIRGAYSSRDAAEKGRSGRSKSAMPPWMSQADAASILSEAMAAVKAKRDEEAA